MWPMRHLRTAQTTGQKLAVDAAFAFFVTLVVGLVLASLSVAGVITMTVAICLLVVAWLVAMAGTFLMPHIWNPSHNHRILFGVVLAVLLSVIGMVEVRYQPSVAQRPPRAGLAHETTDSPSNSQAESDVACYDASKANPELQNLARLFVSASKEISERLGRATDCLRLIPRSSLSQFEHATEVWLYAPKRFFIFPRNGTSWESFNESFECGKDYKCNGTDDLARTKYFEGLFRDRLPKGFYAPFGATANLLIQTPSRFKDIGWMEWDCEMYMPTLYQSFQHGQEFGIYPSAWSNNNGKVWILLNDEKDPNKGTYETRGVSVAGAACEKTKSFAEQPH